MNVAQLASHLLAKTSPWHHLGDGIHGRRSSRVDLIDYWPLALLLVIAAVVVAVVVAMRKRNDMTQHCNDPQKLFRELSLAHNLDRASQKLLWQLAQAFELAQPAEVFVQPSLFTTEKLPQQLHSEAERLQALQQRLF